MGKSNHLLQETSPYLKQHAYNPVDWYPWSEEALHIAQKENKPILLSIGYSACHWCHVMAHESFEDQETADLMNDLFVNIKVDREERPDLDKVYQTAHYLLTRQSGGWPLIIFLTPDDLTPFFSGTYFPLVSRHQLPAFKDVLRGLANFYRERPEDIKKQNVELRKILTQTGPETLDVQLNAKALQLAEAILQSRFDPVYGGFSPPPKFPQPTILEFLLLNKSLMAKDTLQHMSEGGIYDHLGGGFFRYSVDEKWEIPHFEKMLYDNGQMTSLYAHASFTFSEPAFLEIARECADWIINNMQSPEGGYFSSISADSEGHEGKYYIFTKEAIKALLTHEENEFVQTYFGLDQPPNFENEWHLRVVKPLETVAKDLKISMNEAKKLLQTAKKKLLAARKKRIAPEMDEKILTSWNALMIKGMLNVYVRSHEKRFLNSAHSALHLIQEKLWRDHHLFATYKDGRTNLPAYLDDYAYLLDALITSLQIEWNKKHLLFAIDLANILLEKFYDQTNGGFFFTANDHEKLLYRPKSMMDEAIPSSNGVAVIALLTLGHLLGEQRYLDAATKTLQAAWPYLQKYPSEHCSLLLGLKEILDPSPFVVIRGEKKEMEKWLEKAQKTQTIVFAIPNDERDLPGFLNELKPRGKVCAYLCRGVQCEAPIEDFAAFSW